MTNASNDDVPSEAPAPFVSVQPSAAPPVDNAHVAQGCEQFTPFEIAVNGRDLIGALRAQNKIMLVALQKIANGPLTVAGPPDVVSAVEDYHELICGIARAAIAKAEGR